MQKKRRIELLAPARNADIAIEAIKHGADAVYIGASSHGARNSAANPLPDIERVVNFAHKFRVRTYVTLNTLIYDHELEQVRSLVHSLYNMGVDALIVQDMALLRLDIPPIALHASTQCDIRTPEKALFLARAGFSQLVLPRELTLDETIAIRNALPHDIELEAFVHGALCVSYSGDCQAGMFAMGRSANRGECPQICRHAFNLTDAAGHKLIENRHLLSLRDLNRSQLIGPMLEAGISSFKIEGRLKDAAYVKNTVAAYRKAIDNLIEANPDRYIRASTGVTTLSFTPDLDECFNRGYTTYFTTSASPDAKMASHLTPKWTGREVAQVIGASPKGLRVKMHLPVSNGDGLGFFSPDGKFTGFRVNRVDNDTIIPATPPVKVPRGTTLYRNHNRLRDEAMLHDTARRTIPADITLRAITGGIAIDAATIYGNHVTVTGNAEHVQARNDQSETHRRALCKTGDTIFTTRNVTDLAPGMFIPLSQLTSLRRKALDALERDIMATHPFQYRLKEDPAATPAHTELTYHDNVANEKAALFYTGHGATSIEQAMEIKIPSAGPPRVMTTRYCLRRETGRCLRKPEGREWPSDLYLESGPMRFRLEFDCKNCRMHLLAVNRKQSSADK